MPLSKSSRPCQHTQRPQETHIRHGVLWLLFLVGYWVAVPRGLHPLRPNTVCRRETEREREREREREPPRTARPSFSSVHYHVPYEWRQNTRCPCAPSDIWGAADTQHVAPVAAPAVAPPLCCLRRPGVRDALRCAALRCAARHCPGCGWLGGISSSHCILKPVHAVPSSVRWAGHACHR
jgi:hypothetical protein